MDPETKYRPGHPPHDAINGLRVGAFAGGVIGALAVWLLDLSSIWVILVLAVVGGVYGFFSERRKSRL